VYALYCAGMKKLLVFCLVAPLALVTLGANPAIGSLTSHSADAAPVMSTVLFHNVDPTFGVSGAARHELAVVAVGRLPALQAHQDYRLPFVVRNGMSQTMGTLNGYATVWSPGGALVATGSDQGFNPAWLLPGQEGFAFIYLEPRVKVPAGSTVKVSIGGWPLSNLSTFFTDLRVVSAKITGQQVVGVMRNPRPDTVLGPGSVTLYCVSAAGRFLGEPIWNVPMIPSAGLGAGVSASFSVNLRGQSCPTFVVGAWAVDFKDWSN